MVGVDLNTGKAAQVVATAQAAGREPTVVYFADDAGNVGSVVSSTTEGAAIPDGCHEISEQEFDARSAELETANTSYVQELHRSAAEQAAEDFGALRKLGIPAGLAARLSGHAGGGT